MMSAYTVYVGADGRLAFVYDDELQPLLELGAAAVRRASQVEPAAGGWTADLGLSGGPVLGPFPLRAAALAAEVNWIEDSFAGKTPGETR